MKSTSRKNLQLVGVAALLIASKYEELYPPEVQDFVYITDNTYTKNQILLMEKHILKVRMTQPTNKESDKTGAKFHNFHVSFIYRNWNSKWVFQHQFISFVDFQKPLRLMHKHIAYQSISLNWQPSIIISPSICHPRWVFLLFAVFYFQILSFDWLTFDLCVCVTNLDCRRCTVHIIGIHGEALESGNGIE